MYIHSIRENIIRYPFQSMLYGVKLSDFDESIGLYVSHVYSSIIRSTDIRTYYKLTLLRQGVISLNYHVIIYILAT